MNFDIIIDDTKGVLLKKNSLWFQDNSTMLIEAAKGGHTTVVSVLIDYNPGNLSGSEEGGVAVEGGVASEAITEVVSDTELIPTRFPAEGHEQASSATQPAPPAVSSLPNKSKYVNHFNFGAKIQILV